ncbi:MAG: hypothetical protein FWC78_07885 [Defluviitaleaceae bacterium]|nr:hypothetical protein [Defluviitaleaceae bacterium]
MIDFKQEITKFKPVMTVDEVETNMRDEIVDIMDLLQYISGKSVGEVVKATRKPAKTKELNIENNDE